MVVSKLLIKGKWILSLLLPLLWFALPLKPLFNNDYSKVIFSSDSTILRVWLSNDEQFRFEPSQNRLPPKYISALLTFEDKRFYYHVGVDPISIVRAVLVDIKSGSFVQGGSTITMQVARMSNRSRRTIFVKIIEAIRAIKISLHLSKEEVLREYSSHVPMGGNIVGIDAASFRYFNKPPNELSWAEAALFAVLPNNPGMIDLSRKRGALLKKRDRLLFELFKSKLINREDLTLSLDEPLPTVNKTPFIAPHFTRLLNRTKSGNSVYSTLDLSVQKSVNNNVNRYMASLKNSGINNCAVLVANSRTGEVLGYVGSQDYFDKSSNGEIDGVNAIRSSGSLLKPFLVAALIDRGPFTPISIIQDVPTFFGTFAPQNATQTFMGAVTLQDALKRSLNVPFVRLLNYYGINDFYNLLNRGGLTLKQAPNYYGLTLIIGGAETSLYNLSRLYLSLSNNGLVRDLITTKDCKIEEDSSRTRLFSEGAVELTRNIMTDIKRPGFERYRSVFTNRNYKIAWKTGTSYGQKDGWAIGFNGDYLISVWVGNFTGEGNHGIGGAKSAAPLLFSIFNSLPSDKNFVEFSRDSMEYERICKKSGYPAGEFCKDVEEIILPIRRTNRKVCPYHKVITVNSKGDEEVCSKCWKDGDYRSDTLFILPPLASNIYGNRGFEVDTIPKHRQSCTSNNTNSSLRLLYPSNNIKIFSPRIYSGKRKSILFTAVDRNSSSEIFWYIDKKYIGSTKNSEPLQVDTLSVGRHKLYIEDEFGGSDEVWFSWFWKD